MTDSPPKALKVFLSYCSEDKPPVRALYRYLVNAGFDVWMDEKKLLPGQDWDLEINTALHDADAVIVVFSKNTARKEGYIQKELRLALDRSQEKPDGTIYLIPARLEECEIPRRWSHLHYIDLNQSDSGKKLIEALNKRAYSLENKKQVAAKSELVIDEFIEPHTVPAVQIQQTELPPEYKESLLALHYYLTRGSSIMAGFFAALTLRPLYFGYSPLEDANFLSTIVDLIAGSKFVFAVLALIAMSGAGLLFHYLDIQQFEKLKVPLELRYVLSLPVGYLAGAIAHVMGVFMVPLAIILFAILILVKVFKGNP